MEHRKLNCSITGSKQKRTMRDQWLNMNIAVQTNFYLKHGLLRGQHQACLEAPLFEKQEMKFQRIEKPCITVSWNN